LQGKPLLIGFDSVTVPLDFRTVFLRFPDFSLKRARARRTLAALPLQGGTPLRSNPSLPLLDKRNQPMNGQLAIAVL
jgi:hypothetical protein